jgi:ubiquinone/menaquinone biosynthesis C-methylase UbiE
MLEQDMLPLVSHIRYIQGFAEDLPFEDNFFDLVIISNTLDHVKDMKKAVNEIWRVLKKDGYVLFITYLKVKKPHPFTFQSVSEARNMFRGWGLIEEHHIIPDRPFNKRNEQYVGIFRKL